MASWVWTQTLLLWRHTPDSCSLKGSIYCQAHSHSEQVVNRSGLYLPCVITVHPLPFCFLGLIILHLTNSSHSGQSSGRCEQWQHLPRSLRMGWIPCLTDLQWTAYMSTDSIHNLIYFQLALENLNFHSFSHSLVVQLNQYHIHSKSIASPVTLWMGLCLLSSHASLPSISWTVHHLDLLLPGFLVPFGLLPQQMAAVHVKLQQQPATICSSPTAPSTTPPPTPLCQPAVTMPGHVFICTWNALCSVWQAQMQGCVHSKALAGPSPGHTTVCAPDVMCLTLSKGWLHCLPVSFPFSH